jgi:hypothetical protein
MSYKSNNATFASKSGIKGEAAGSNPADSLSSSEVTALQAIAAETPNYVESSSCGDYTRTAETFADVTNLSVSITVGSDDSYVEIGLLSTGSNATSYWGCEITGGSSVSNVSAVANITRDSTIIGYFEARKQASSNTTQRIRVPVTTIKTIESPGAGTYTYKVQLRENTSGATTTARVFEAKLYAREIRR